MRFRFDSETIEQFAERYASDVSRGGIFVHSRQPFAVGTQLKLNLQLLDGTPLIVGEGTVFWTREPDPNKPATVPGMGVRFSKLSSSSQRVIELVLSQRTGRERSGLFPTLGPSVIVEETGRHATQKSKLPFNVFPGRAAGSSLPADESRELLAEAGREETTPLVGVSAATLADARPGKDEPPSKVPATRSRGIIADSVSGAQAAPANAKRNPPALALIKPGSDEGQEAAKTIAGAKAAAAPDAPAQTGHTGKTNISARGRASMTTIPTLTTTQELVSPVGATPPAPVQGERVLGASQSGAVAAVLTTTSSAPVTTARPSHRNKLIIGAAALFAVSLTIFAVTRHGAGGGDAKSGSAMTVAGALAGRVAVSGPTARAPDPAVAAVNVVGSEAAAGPALEPDAPAVAGSARSGSSSPSASSSARVADRRAPKGKPAVGHRPGDNQAASRPSAPSERPTVAEAPAHAESPAPAPTPSAPPPVVTPAPVARAERIERAERAEPAAAAKSLVPTAPPPVAALAHKLRLTSIPSDAEVELDGKVIGKTPLFGVEVDITRPHAVVVRKDGFAPFKQAIGAGSEWSIRSSENMATLRISAFMKKLGAP